MHYNDTYNRPLPTTLRHVVMAVVYTLMTLLTVPATAQVVIGGDVYGGGNEGDVAKSAAVELKGGNIYGNVYGGARRADVGGYTFVNINGEGASDSIIVKGVYGGNDISGTIGSAQETGEELPTVINAYDDISKEYNSFVYASTNTTHPVIIGSLYGGGNGNYTDVDYTLVTKPELDRTCIILNGGVYGNIYGGGNKVTVEENAIIRMNNTTSLIGLNSIPKGYAGLLGLHEGADYHIDGNNLVLDYHVGRMFGGNNLADMAIRPTWYLQQGDINNLYSGGNRGRMTYEHGIILPLRSDKIRVNNVYGGCRIADVYPGLTTPAEETIKTYDFKTGQNTDYTFAAGYAARVYITGGSINNVYGGNDISGKVYYGTNVEVHGAISGDIYGGGNGSYAYTDQAEWVAAHPADADYYYDPGSNSLDSLYMYRPHVENTLVHITGNDPDHPVVVAGGVYCGGNSATLDKNGDQAGATATFRIGRYTIINSVFLGSNGENMVTEDILKRYADKDFSSLTLTNADEFEKYMNGVAVNIIPTLEWDNIDYTTQIGSLIFGGNKGSMTYEGLSKITVPRELIIFEKVVGGCNDACVVESAYNAAYHGGLRQPGEMIDGENIKVWLDVDAYLIPKKLVLTHDATGRFLDSWEHTWDMTEEISYETFDNQKRTSRTFIDANIYGGCFNSGHVNGGVVINIDQPLIHPDVLSDETIPGTSSTAYEIMVATGEDVYGSAMAVYGGGYGALSEVQGNTHINLSGNAQVLLAFGGGELGTVSGNTEVNFDHEIVFPEKGYNVYKAYGAGYAGLVEGNSTLNLAGGSILRGFGGACNAHVEGVSAAIVGWRDEVKDIYNYGKPYVGNAVFGGNDFGGHVKGNTLREIKVKTAEGEITQKVRSQTYVQYISGELEKALYGGSYGSYNYTDNTIYNRGVPLGNGPMFTSVINDADPTVITTNTFVNIDSKSRSPLDFIGSGMRKDPSMITGIVGGGRGYRNLPGYVAVNQTYLLLHGTIFSERESLMASRIYGGGNLSNVTNTHIDAYSGNFDMMFGGTHGVKTVSMDDNVAYNVGNTLINIYEGMEYEAMDIYGAGANSGTDRAEINLYGGKVNNVHGGAYTEGYTLATYINVPKNSTAQVNAIYGGGQGEEEGRPCDVGKSNILYASEDATTRMGIFGGNNTARVTTQTNIVISAPVKDNDGVLQSVYGAGYGSATVSGFTLVDLQEGAQAANVYGGGKQGKVYNHYRYYGNTKEGNDAVVDYYSKAPHRYGNWINGTIQPDAVPRSIDTGIMTNTLVLVREGATVDYNVYGGGEGELAYVSGQTKVHLLGGSVAGDIYGGGYAGAMPLMTETTNGYINTELAKQKINTRCVIDGGEVRNVFGGGYKGNTEGNTYVSIGKTGGTSFYDGVPTIQRSAYGGGEMAEVTGTATVDMHNGYIGYTYTAGNGYQPLLDLKKADDGLLKENGNLYGAGYGEGAVVMNAHVNLYNGTIRNGLYGGGEIAAVGRGSVKLDNNKYVLATFDAAGETHVRMYGGIVEGDVFGGGRGFSYDLTGNQIAGQKYYTDGYVFGTTDVEIYRGIIGTDASVKDGHGNVFGGGNIGYVYSPGVKYSGETTGDKINGHYYVDDTYTERTEDCRVHITARCLALEDVQVGDKQYKAGQYVLTEDLDTLDFGADETWSRLDSLGITIRNAVFAGGNVSAGSDKIYANAVTVYGNATAAVVDVFAKDFVRLGGEHVGGLYGDGNLTFVDGYRELNITNYGTDYYNLSQELTYDQYLLLSDREKDYYSLMYELKAGNEVNFTYNGVTYDYRADAITPTTIVDATYRAMLNAWISMHIEEMKAKWEEEGGRYTPNETIGFTYNGKNYTYYVDSDIDPATYTAMLEAYAAKQKADLEAKWDVMGVCAVTAGRMMNTIQRADFCGVFGSRMVLHGAQDRVPDVVDYTNYTINRVKEVSLNRVKQTLQGDSEATEHGNYFGIYNIVNFLGALTSDVEFASPRKADEKLDDAYGTTTYFDFKNHNLNNRVRNNATSNNMVAMSSGAYLELVDSLDKDGNKVYGPVTGIIQLDMINVQPGEGGGYVYAKNEHGEPHPVDAEKKAHLTLSDANKGAITQAAFTYDSNNLRLMQTSGNFVHPMKRVVDDCFPRGGYYDMVNDGSNYSPAHYWYIRGDFYVYDQYLSAYTGAAQAYSQSVNIPLTITAGSDGKMELVSINPNKYAYFVGKHYKDGILTANDSILAGTTTYHMNDPISYWEWSQLSVTDQAYFVDSTYVAICDATTNGIPYKKGDVFLPKDYRALLAQNAISYVYDDNNDPIKVRTDSVFRITNELSHKAGYLLTFDITNPVEWNDYMTTIDGTTTTSILKSKYNDEEGYLDAPTLLCNESGIYGQYKYELDNIVNASIIEHHRKLAESTDANIQAAYTAILNDQAKFEDAYVVTGEIYFNYKGVEHHMYKNSYMSKTMYDHSDLEDVRDSIEKAYVCINTIEIADKEYVLYGDLIPASQYETLKTQTGNAANTFLGSKKIEDYFSPAYVCTKEGKYGGTYFQQTKNYEALQFCGLPYEERNKMNGTKPVFNYNYDALDLLATDFNPDIDLYQRPYSIWQHVDYEAKYIGKDDNVLNETYTYKSIVETDGAYTGATEEKTITEGQKLNRNEYELILNEKAYFMPISVTKTDSTYYVVKDMFEKANVYNPVGKSISKDEYDLLTADQKSKVSVFEKGSFAAIGTYYYCAEGFTLSQETQDMNLPELDSKTAIALGECISSETFKELPNYQTGFAISGHSPVETSTLYVSRESDILNLSEDRIITVVYKYTYKEGSTDGGYETFAEKHIVNIHVQFKSGLPTIGEVTPPATVLPNSVVGLSVPSVTKGAYEILGGGWEMFETISDANEHKNGITYKNNATPMYWYQNNYYVSYYAKTYLGKTYSKPVPFSVANYHRMGEVMSHKVNGKNEYMYIDHKDVDRDSKIYIDSAAYAATSIAAGEIEKNDLDFLYDLYTASLDGNKLNARVKGADSLVFILRSDIEPKKYKNSWTSVGNNSVCFKGKLHGNGHTINNLTSSLFGYLCDSVYNLGVKGSFTGGGVADHGGEKGYAENCWVYTTGEPTTKAVIGDRGTIINSYYSEEDAFAEGDAIKETKTDLEQGEVAYQLNRFFLHKRYSDNNTAVPNNEAYKYKYYVLNTDDNTLSIDSSYYAAGYAIYPHKKAYKGYVENYYADGDFIYANGEIPLENDERFDMTTNMYYPIYPDDYIFFGQRLSYDENTHNDWPVCINKVTDNEGRERIVRANNGNRVYRAPAYYMSKAKDDIYFNINAAFTDKYNGIFVDHNMTAIDFTGYNDHVYSDDTGPVFYTPYLDYEGLVDISINGLTPNLLVYADPQNDATSYKKLNDYLYKPVLAYGDYSKIAPQTNLASIHGHLVDLTDEGEYKATRDHFLVDKENFNAPIAYQFDAGYHMWYQRIPEDNRFANGDGKGWDIVCLPFTAGLVTTHEKGEITHFYGDDDAMHEYWLREFKEIKTEGGETKAAFARPAASPDDRYTANSTFLNDYYYSKYDDKNTDSYQNYYANGNRRYDDYAYLTRAVPYIVAFPGERYYEFDMSGQFIPANTSNAIGKLNKQVITMVSTDKAEIAVSDDEMRSTSANGYTFKGVYQTETLSDGYMIDEAGGEFDAVTTVATTVPFRGYLVAPSSPAPPRRIFISGAAEEDEPMDEITNRGLTIYSKNQAIYIESTLEYETTVIVYSLSGQVIKRITIQPMDKEVVPVPSRGVYIVNEKKVAVL